MRIATACHQFLRSTACGCIAAMAPALLPSLACAATLVPGDFVTVTWQSGTAPCCQVFALDATSMAASLLTSDGYIAEPTDVAVTRDGNILVAVPTAGVVRVVPASGHQAIFASVESLGGGAPQGILATADAIYVTIQGSQPRVVRLNPDGSVAGVVSSGGLLAYPSGIALGPDGALYVCETIPVGWKPGGSLLRIDPASGAQTLIASGDPIHGPLHAAFAPDGSLWSVQRGGLLHEKRGSIVRTRISDGFSELVDFGFNSVSGIAIRPDGLTVVADCASVHSDCEYPYTQVYPDGPRANWISGSVAIVPEMATPTTRTTWGRIKLIYR
jgi:streptogramin lyase